MLLIQDEVFESRWTLLLILLVVVGMLALFHAVVSGAAQAGELRRQAEAARIAAVLRCNAQPNGNASKACLKDLEATAAAAEAPTVLAAQSDGTSSVTPHMYPSQGFKTISFEKFK